MPPRRSGKKGQGASPPAAVGDRLSALPDELLHHVLSFLPAEDAVRTCLLARRWRDLWKSATSLQIRRILKECDPVTVKAAREFVDQLLLRRKAGTPIDTRTLSFIAGSGDLSDEIPRLKLWVRHILKCKARVLTIDYQCRHLKALTLISDHLKVLHLDSIGFGDKLIDFSCSPALKELTISFCNIAFVDTISSQSLKCLEIIGCSSSDDCRVCIDTPNLHLLHLEVFDDGRIPFLQKMPSLVEAFFNTKCVQDCCYNSHGSGDCGDVDCDGCYGVDGDSDHCVLLQGLSEAQNLVLKSDVEMFIFRRDLKFHPIYGNLRTLLLNEYWCLPTYFSALAYMLHHSPNLEKLTLELYLNVWRPKFGMKGRCNSTELSTGISRNLKILDVKCKVIDESILKVLKFLGTLGISFSFNEVEIFE